MLFDKNILCIRNYKFQENDSLIFEFRGYMQR